MNIPNLQFIRSLPDIGARLYEAFKAVQDQTTNIEQQTNTAAQQQPTSPPPINKIHVSTGPGGEFQIAITDNGQISRGINYFAEHDSSPNFTNPHVVDMGQSRNASLYLGNQTLHWRGYSSYASSLPSVPAYHGSQSQPIPVTGGVPGIRSQSQGSGTGAPGQGLQGPGPVPTRSANSGFNWTAQGNAQGVAQGTAQGDTQGKA
jgi:hypothetical protein